MISLKNISKSYTSHGEKVTLFTELDWQIEQWAFTALMGASGAGKSSLISLIAGIISPDVGSIYLEETKKRQEQDLSIPFATDTTHSSRDDKIIDIASGRNDKITDITKLSRDEMIAFRGQHIAFIFQAFELIPNLTVTENIDLVLDISHAPRRYTTDEILERVGLVNKWNRYPTELSGGEQQRVAIARAFVSDVPYLFADEPTGNLDEANAKKIMELITELHGETENTIIMITHDRDIAGYADRTYRLHDQRLIVQ
jgi:putative ABC transport system ATP-binding protein